MGWHWGILSASGAAVAGAYELISTQVLASDTSSVTFNSLSSANYKHLQLRLVVRSTRAAAGDSLYMRINSDTGSNYAYHNLNGTGSAVGSYGLGSTDQSYIGTVAGASQTTSSFSAFVVDILDFASTSKTKTIRSLNMNQGASSNNIELTSMLWNSTSAITSLTIQPRFSPTHSLLTGSRLSIYGVKG